MWLLHRTQVWFPEAGDPMVANHNSSSKGSSTLFWLLRVVVIQVVHIHVCSQNTTKQKRKQQIFVLIVWELSSAYRSKSIAFFWFSLYVSHAYWLFAYYLKIVDFCPFSQGGEEGLSISLTSIGSLFSGWDKRDVSSPNSCEFWYCLLYIFFGFGSLVFKTSSPCISFAAL